MDRFTREALSRLPLAEATLALFQHALPDDVLQELFAAHRGRAYERILTFADLVRLVADALLEHGGSGHRAFVRADERGALPVSKTAVYGKLERMPLALSDALLREGARRLEAALPVVRSELPRSLRKFDALILDGKKIKHLAKQRKPARGLKGAVLGGKFVALLAWKTGLVAAMHGDPDGERSDGPLVPGLLEQLDADGPPRLYIADRQFCDLVQPRLLTRREGDRFLIRHNEKTSFERDPKRTAKSGVDVRGRTFREEWGLLGAAGRKDRLYVRRITLLRPGEEDVIVLTDLLDNEAYPAVDLLEAYLARWGIERVFQRITEVFHLRHLIATTPEGTLFQAAFCLLLYNLIEVLTRHLARDQRLPPEAVSRELFFHDVHRQLIAWRELIGPDATLPHAMETAELRGRLTALLAPAWTKRWLKSPPKKPPGPKPPQPPTPPGHHTSMHRLLISAGRREAK